MPALWRFKEIGKRLKSMSQLQTEFQASFESRQSSTFLIPALGTLPTHFRYDSLRQSQVFYKSKIRTEEFIPMT